MQDELFLEQMVRRGTDKSVLIKRILIVLSGLVIIAFPYVTSLSAGYLVGPVLMVLVALMIWILWRRAYREYEYVFTGGNLDVDVIFNRSSRKHVATFDVKKARFIGPADNEQNKGIIEGNFDKVIQADTGLHPEQAYVLLGTLGERTCKLVFEPNEELLKAIKRYNPRGTIIK